MNADKATSTNDQGPRSVVTSKYKARYAERAAEMRGKKGVEKRVLADSSGDWLALELAALIRPTKKKPADLDLFEAICKANGVNLDSLPRNTRGWQGRFRMNGSQMLRTAIAEANGEFRVPGEHGGFTTKQAPKSWVARHLPK